MRSEGARAEDLAARYLKKKGYKILQRNFRTRYAEIDIIAEDGPVVVFVEVKSKSSADFGLPSQAVDLKKQAKIKQAALAFLARENGERPARFDVISILPTGLEHIPDAFEIT